MIPFICRSKVTRDFSATQHQSLVISFKMFIQKLAPSASQPSYRVNGQKIPFQQLETGRKTHIYSASYTILFSCCCVRYFSRCSVWCQELEGLLGPVVSTVVPLMILGPALEAKVSHTSLKPPLLFHSFNVDGLMACSACLKVVKFIKVVLFAPCWVVCLSYTCSAFSKMLMSHAVDSVAWCSQPPHISYNGSLESPRLDSH